METKSGLVVAFAVLSPVVLSHAFEEQTPACKITALTPTAQACRDKDPELLHDHHEKADVGNGPRDTNITPNAGHLTMTRPQFFDEPDLSHVWASAQAARNRGFLLIVNPAHQAVMNAE
jgi:hypothetical protein